MSDGAVNGQTKSGYEDENLFGDFTPPTYEEWRAAAEETLKGAPFEKRLITRTYEGIALQPIYRQEDVADVAGLDALPGFAPYLRSANAAGYLAEPWGIAQELPYSTPEAFNQALLFDLARGQTVINLVLDPATRTGLDPDQDSTGGVGKDGVSVASMRDLEAAFTGVDLEQYPLLVRVGTVGLPIAAMLVALMRQQGKDLTKLQGWIESDPLGVLVRNGSMPLSLERAYDEMALLLRWAAKNAPELKTIAVHGHHYHNSGGNAIQELGFALATSVAYIRAMIERGLDIETIAPRIGFSFSVGSNFFMEIAKLRAARLIWSKVVAAFGGSEEAQRMTLHVRASEWNKTAYDPYVNMLRTTVEAFAGAMGGCNSMHVAPFDMVLRQPDEFARRIARNTQIILQTECQFTKVIDPAGGSWYVESLTDQLARGAWELFQQVEGQGGMEAALRTGSVQQQIKKVADERIANLGTRKDVLVGTNMYPNLNESPLPDQNTNLETVQKARAARIEQERASDSDHSVQMTKLAELMGANDTEQVEAAIEAAAAGATLSELARTLWAKSEADPAITPLQMHRVSELFEELRKAAEAYKARTGKRPQIFMANMGPIPQHKPRADFSMGFFEVGGFEMLKNNGFATVDEAAAAALASGAPVVVICSTDDTYPELVPPLTQQLKAANANIRVILAGYPKEQVESFKAAGIDEFIHVRANCYAILSSLQQEIGVNA